MRGCSAGEAEEQPVVPMAQAHMDRLTSIDASFLTNETSSAHMHVGAILIFEGPPPSYDDFLAHVESRLHLVPRFRQKLAFPPVETGRPFWVDDPSFNLAYHVRHSALPAPGSEEQLRNIAGRLFSQALDRSKPLWELWLVQGLERNRFALVTKTHHALVDGVAGVDIATVLFDLKPVPEPDRARPRLGAPPLAVGRRARGPRNRRGRRSALQARTPRDPRRQPPEADDPEGRRRRRGVGRGRLEPEQSRPGRAAERGDRIPPAVRLGPSGARRLQADQGRARRDGQRRRTHRGERRTARLAAQSRRQARGPRPAGARAGLDQDRGRAGPASATGSRRCAARCPSTSGTR